MACCDLIWLGLVCLDCWVCASLIVIIGAFAVVCWFVVIVSGYCFVVVGVRFPICRHLGFDVSGSVLLLGVLLVGLCCLFYYGFISCFVALVVAWFEVLMVLMVACCGLLVLDCFYCGLECLLSACFYLLRWVG